MEVLSSTRTNPSQTKRFECHICSEPNPNEPVVTLCGHIYCWPCIYQWLHDEPQISNHHGDEEEPPLIGQKKKKKNCPVCEAEISGDFLVPLYGRGSSTPTRSSPVNAVPRRPSSPKFDLSACNYLAMKEFHRSFCVQSPIRGSETTPYHRSGMFGSADNVFLFPTYPEAGYRTPAMRRAGRRAERSLDRLSLFLFCCVLMCLVFFWLRYITGYMMYIWFV